MHNGVGGPMDSEKEANFSEASPRENLEPTEDDSAPQSLTDSTGVIVTGQSPKNGSASEALLEDKVNPFVQMIDRSGEQKAEGGTGPDRSSGNGQTKPSNPQVIFTPHGFEFQPQVVTPGPNPTRIPPDDFIKALAGFTNMYLAHEISIDPDYKLERYVHPPGSIENRIEQQMKRAFWDVLDESLNATPPDYSHALSIFEEMKVMLLSLLMPHHRSLKDRINEVLDADLIKQQVQHEALDFKKYADFIIDILSQLCAPSRDEEIAALRQLGRPVELFRGILAVMENMKLDLANFYVQQFRPTVIQNCCSYERAKFAEFLELEYRLEQDGLRNTRTWLATFKDASPEKNLVISKSFADILTWSPAKESWPETLALDAIRLLRIANTVKRLSIVGGVILTTESLCQSQFELASPTIRAVLKEQLDSLLTDDDVEVDSKLEECLCGVAEQVIKIIGEDLNTKGRIMTDDEKNSLRKAITDLGNPDHKIRQLLVKRTVEYAEAWLAASKNTQIPIPSGLNCINPEISVTVKNFCRIAYYNRAVFDSVYSILLDHTGDSNEEWSSISGSLQKCIQSLSAASASASGSSSSSSS